ncbi:hypothetical protein TWF132_008191 [Orbilia oligospora]|nr:hypothetical protein TWF751_005022 [Orbilia oligospora]KAF3287948.1 hypothetical protein TWF132_008191 [Orbilia oligospora]
MQFWSMQNLKAGYTDLTTKIKCEKYFDIKIPLMDVNESVCAGRQHAPLTTPGFFSEQSHWPSLNLFFRRSRRACLSISRTRIGPLTSDGPVEQITSPF